MRIHIRTTAITLAVLTGCSGFLFADIHEDLIEVPFAIRVTYAGDVLEVINAALSPDENTNTVTSTNWTGYVNFKASFSGANQIVIETTIGGITQEQSGWFTWNGTGYAGSYVTSNGYTIELADQTYFGDTPDPDPDPDPTETSNLVPYFYRLELVGAFIIGILLWQVLIKSWRSGSLYI